MGGNIIVMKPEDYAAWLTAGAPSDNLATTGEHLFRELGCSGCHAGKSVVPAPRLEGLYGRPVPLASGEIINADEQFIRDSILLPSLHVVAGYTNAMPTFQGHVSEEQIVQLVAYIRSLAGKQPPEEMTK
jgi:cytochrome c oxidase subunit 2